jgi:hypothetical protein
MNKYEGWLFGHYDSRGGASFYVGFTKETALAEYADTFGDPGMDADTFRAQLEETDFLGPATLETKHTPKDGEDLEYRTDDQVLWVRVQDETNPHFELRLSEDRPEEDGFIPAELGEDAFGVLFITEPMI